MAAVGRFTGKQTRRGWVLSKREGAGEMLVSGADEEGPGWGGQGREEASALSCP